VRLNPFKLLRDLINERGSAAMMEKRLALKDDEIAKLQSQIRDLKAADEKQKFEADEIVIHKGIEFRRGIKTAGKWMAFCTKCHLPAEQCLRIDHNINTQDRVVVCSARCGWSVFMPTDLHLLIAEL
jgi:RNase P subunit RPR2